MTDRLETYFHNPLYRELYKRFKSLDVDTSYPNSDGSADDIRSVARMESWLENFVDRVTESREKEEQLDDYV